MRAAIFISTGCYGVIPMIHVANRWGRVEANEMVGWNMMFWEGIAVFAGAAIYAVGVQPV